MSALEDGVPLIDHLRAAERQTGQTPQMLLDAPKLPEECAELWTIFWQLHACRNATMGGPMPITFVDIDAFQRVMGVKLKPWELQAIRRADRAYLADWHERQPKPNP